MFAIKIALTSALSLLLVTAFWLVIGNQLALSLVGFIIGLCSYLFSDWFVDWAKDNI